MLPGRKTAGRMSIWQHGLTESLGKFVFALFALTLIIAYHPAAASAEEPSETTVEATGFATVTDTNTAIARDAAIDDAMRKAVEQAVGTMVSSDTMVQNYQMLQDNVYTKTQGYIRNYKVTKEGQTGTMYQVTVRATVAVGNLKSDLDAIGLLHVKSEKPRVLFMIAEQNIGQKYFVYWWMGKSEYMGETVNISAAETSMKEAFINKGFNVVEASQGPIETSNAYRVADLTNAASVQIGRKLNAEIVIKGKAIAKEGPRTPGSTVGSYLADITATAIRVDTGTVLGSAKGHGVSRHVSDVTGGTEAIGKAADELSEKLMEQILAKWSSGNMITLTVRGMTDYRKAADLKDTLKKRVRGIQGIYQRSFEGGVAVFEIDAKVSTQAIADELARLKGFSLSVTNTTQNTIEVQMQQ